MRNSETHNIGTLKTPLISGVRRLFESSSHSLTVVAPYINCYGLDALRESTQNRKHKLAIRILTCISAQNLCSGSLDIEALTCFAADYPACRITSLTGLHAKVYVADSTRAIITSANLTYGGLVGNHEYGVLLTGTRVVSTVQKDLLDYSDLGSEMQLADLRELTLETKKIKAADKAAVKAFALLHIGVNSRARSGCFKTTCFASTCAEHPSIPFSPTQCGTYLSLDP